MLRDVLVAKLRSNFVLAKPGGTSGLAAEGVCEREEDFSSLLKAGRVT